MLIESVVKFNLPKYLIILILRYLSFSLIAFDVCQIVLYDNMVGSLDYIWIQGYPAIDVLESVFNYHIFHEKDNETNSCYPIFSKFEENHHMDIKISSF
jgi:hypothetical protein